MNTNTIFYTLAFETGKNNQIRYIDCEDSKNGTFDEASAMMFDTIEQAQAYNDEHGYVCWVSEYQEEVLTYDVVFDSDTDSNNKGFKATLDFCENYIKMHNGTNESYFKNYKGGIVSIICNETEVTVFETEII